MRRPNQKQSDRLIGNWLILMALLVVAMIIVGGATRLTDSGLSIAHWSPIHGAIPPLSENDWQAEFALYKTIPEFKFQNQNMQLTDFKFIFWWEWGHRFLGRFFGLAYLIPLCFFWYRGHLHSKDTPILIVTVFLIGLQGFLGWWMVSSGLKGSRLDVEAIRLSIHLGMAFFLLAILVSGAHFRITGKGYSFKENPWTIILIFAFIQILLGALTAGSDAGLAHNDWPKIDGRFLPNEYFKFKPFYLNFFENTQNIQFNHRIMGYVLGIMILWRALSSIGTRRRVNARQESQSAKYIFAGLMVLIQICLGILTLHVFSISPPPTMLGVVMGIVHQTSGAILFVIVVLCWKSYPNYNSKY